MTTPAPPVGLVTPAGAKETTSHALGYCGLGGRP